MKRPGLTSCAVAATLFLGATLPAADQPAPSMKSGKAEEILRRLDKNSDGRIDDDERADAVEASLKVQVERRMARETLPTDAQVRARIIEFFDENHDGRLDDDERAAARKFAETPSSERGSKLRDELVARFDANRDGKLDAGERTELQKWVREFLGPVAAFPAIERLRAELLQQFDQNTDGKIDEAEMAALEKALRLRFAANAARLQRYDHNGDGQLDENEWATAREEIRRILNTPPKSP